MIESLVVLLAALLVLLLRGPGLPVSDGQRADRLRHQAKALYHQGRVGEAATLMAQAVDILKKSAGPDHPHTKAAMEILAVIQAERPPH